MSNLLEILIPLVSTIFDHVHLFLTSLYLRQMTL